jgi:hypothetical protein
LLTLTPNFAEVMLCPSLFKTPIMDWVSALKLPAGESWTSILRSLANEQKE